MRFANALVLGLSLFVGLGASEGAAWARSSGAYIDILSAQAVGEFRKQTYDVYRRSGDHETFLGNQELHGNHFLGGGLGLRIVYGMKSGVRFSGEGSVAGGRMLGGELPWAATSTAVRGELLGGFGYQAALGPLVLHGAAIVGMDYMSFKATAPILQPGTLTSALLTTSAASSEPSDFRLERYGLRAGVQAGAHLQLGKSVALYSDVTFDYDGQWRARLGFAVGNVRR